MADTPEILDCFCGVGAWATRDPILPYAVADIQQQMDRFGVGRALVYPNAVKFVMSPAAANQNLGELIRGNPRFIPAFCLALQAAAADAGADAAFGLMKEHGARALWLNIPFSPYRLAQSLAPWLVGTWLERCVSTRLPVLLHVEDGNVDRVHELCSAYPGLRVILTGAFYSGDNYLFPLLHLHPNLRLCLGHMYIPSGSPAAFLEQFPAERLLFGSGLPEFSPGGMIAHVMYADIPDAAKARILGGNLAALLGEVTL